MLIKIIYLQDEKGRRRAYIYDKNRNGDKGKNEVYIKLLRRYDIITESSDFGCRVSLVDSDAKVIRTTCIIDEITDDDFKQIQEEANRLYPLRTDYTKYWD